MAVFNFFLGLCIGFALLWWQRSRADAKLEALARRLRPDVQDYPFSSTSQLTLAITLQQKFQQQQQQQLELHQQILHMAPVSYLQVDDEDQFIWCNQQARLLLGIAPYPDKPRLLLEIVRSYELDELIEQTRETAKPCQHDWVFYPVSADPLHLSEQEAYALRGYAFPLADRQIGIFLENRQEAITLIQQRDRWTSDLAHELKTPLTSIRLVAETLQSRLDPPLKGWVDRLIDETVRLSGLVQDLLDLSRMERGSPSPLQLKSVDLVELVRSVWHSLEPLARKKTLQFDYSGPAKLVIQLDRPRIHRLLVNLLDNSIKYSPPHQSVQVRVWSESSPVHQQPQKVYLEVVDHGPGFPEKSLPHVFDRFYRADPSRSRFSMSSELSSLDSEAHHGGLDWQVVGGSGLGLAIARQIVEAHHGLIQARNHPDTGGAWLQVQLPYDSADPAIQPKV